MIGPEFDTNAGDHGRAGEIAIMAWLKRSNIQATHLPEGNYGVDIICEIAGESHRLEVERRDINWVMGQFAYPNVHVQARRKLTVNDTFITLSQNMEHGLVVFGQDIVDAPTTECDNKRMNQEIMRLVTPQRCLPVCLLDPLVASFGQLNAKRVRDAMDLIHDWPTQMKYLGYTPPYGMSEAEWKTYTNHHRQATAKPVDKQMGLFDAEK